MNSRKSIFSTYIVGIDACVFDYTLAVVGGGDSIGGSLNIAGG